jgi:hypothetical protein
LETVLDFAFVADFLAATSLLEHVEAGKTELKPLLTIFGTHMRARSRYGYMFWMRYYSNGSQIFRALVRILEKAAYSSAQSV